MITATIENVLVKGHPKDKVVVAFSKYEYGFGRSDKLSPEALKEFLSIPDENYLEDSFDVDLQNLEEEYPNEDFNMDIVYSKL
jgi:hypothetical protein